MQERLDRFLASQGLGSRKDAARLTRSGAVTVAGAVLRDPSAKLDPDADEVRVNGKRIVYQAHLYVMLHKPQGVVSATEDSRDTAVPDLLPPELRRRGLSPAGRLDKDTTGLLLLTDDGDFLHRVISPKSGVWKRYAARTARPITGADIAAFAAGLEDGGDRFAPARLWEEDGVALVEVSEGKFHQVKRMFAAVGNQVLSLHRLAIGGLFLDLALKPGECRPLTAEERDAVFRKRQ